MAILTCRQEPIRILKVLLDSDDAVLMFVGTVGELLVRAVDVNIVVVVAGLSTFDKTPNEAFLSVLAVSVGMDSSVVEADNKKLLGGAAFFARGDACFIGHLD